MSDMMTHESTTHETITADALSSATQAAIEQVEASAAHNYHPLPVVVVEASGAWVTDVDGRRYLDCLAAYSAVNFGHGNPRLLAAAQAQLDRVTLTSRAFHNDRSARSSRRSPSSPARTWCCR